MKKSNTIFYLLALALMLSCNNKTVKTVTNTEPISDSEVFNRVQRQTFEYFYSGAEPVSGMARERIHLNNIYPQKDSTVVTSGGSGFGIMALIVGMEGVL